MISATTGPEPMRFPLQSAVFPVYCVAEWISRSSNCCEYCISWEPLRPHILLLLTEFRSILHFYQIVSIDYCVKWVMWRNVATTVIMLTALGRHDQCQLQYHKWQSWWNTQSYAACCCTRDT